MLETTFSPALIWAITGILLLIAELVAASFILVFLGLGAIIAALTTFFGLTTGINSQLVVFSVSSILMMLLLRKTAKSLFFGINDLAPDYLGQKVKVVKTIPVGGEGTIAYRGSDWIAFSDEPDNINEGDIVEITAMEGIRVKVKRVV